MYTGIIGGRSPRTLVLLHGYDANEGNWERVVWGIPPDKPGRIPMAVAVALEENAEHLVLFGSSVGKEVKDGLWWSVGRWMAYLLFTRLEGLKEFTILSALQDFNQTEISENLVKIFRLIEEPDRPANTMGELQAVMRLIREEYTDIQKLVCVSSCDHVSRIIRDASIVFKGHQIAAHLSVRGSLTLYTEEDGKTPPERATLDNVVVAEPRFHGVRHMRRMFGIGNNPEALAEIDAVLKKYGK